MNNDDNNSNCCCNGSSCNKGSRTACIEDDKVLVRDILKTAIMGSQAIDVTRDYVQSPQFQEYLDDLQKTYLAIKSQAEDFMRKKRIDEEILSSVTEAINRGAIKMGMKGTRSDERVAEQLIKGTTMGLEVISKNLNCSSSVSQELIHLAEHIEEVMTESVKELRSWLG